jgi:hypothetical protein
MTTTTSAVRIARWNIYATVVLGIPGTQDLLDVVRRELFRSELRHLDRRR